MPNSFFIRSRNLDEVADVAESQSVAVQDSGVLHRDCHRLFGAIADNAPYLVLLMTISFRTIPKAVACWAGTLVRGPCTRICAST